MKPTERLLRIADYFINRLSPLPLDLAARLMERGVDVETLEGNNEVIEDDINDCQEEN